jgi:hypothetical protein
MHLRPDSLRTQIANLRKLETMKRVVIVGRGASGKSTLARRLGHITGLPVTEVDQSLLATGTPRNSSGAVGCSAGEARRERPMDSVVSEIDSSSAICLLRTTSKSWLRFYSRSSRHALSSRFQSGQPALDVSTNINPPGPTNPFTMGVMIPVVKSIVPTNGPPSAAV